MSKMQQVDIPQIKITIPSPEFSPTHFLQGIAKYLSNSLAYKLQKEWEEKQVVEVPNAVHASRKSVMPIDQVANKHNHKSPGVIGAQHCGGIKSVED
jgi:hypothetical protein